MNNLDALSRLTVALADRYRLERELGQGGMATVYLARDLKHARDVAIKVLKPELGAVLGAERFLNEIRTTANLQHPNLLPLFDSGEADGLLYYVMPFVEGETLRARMDAEQQLPVDETIRLMTLLAGALDFAHARGVVHRDLKPENILLQAGQPVIADFGIALAVTQAGGERITETGLSLGTPHYMSPEQAAGTYTVDARSDQYALGAIAYELLVGEPPHTGASTPAVLVRRSVRPVSEQIWRADGQGIVVRTTTPTAGNGDILVTRSLMDTTGAPLLDSERTEYSPAVSPDGRWLAYVSNRTGRFEVYVTPFDAPESSRTLISAAGGSSPRWARDGSAVFYLDFSTRMMEARVATSPEFSVLGTSALFNASAFVQTSFSRRNYDVAPDGRFLMVRRADRGRPGAMVVVEHWTEELTATFRP